MASENLPPITVSVDEFQRLSGLGPTKTWALIKDGKLESVKIGRRRLITYESAQRLLAAHAESAA